MGPRQMIGGRNTRRIISANIWHHRRAAVGRCRNPREWNDAAIGGQFIETSIDLDIRPTVVPWRRGCLRRASILEINRHPLAGVVSIPILHGGTLPAADARSASAGRGLWNFDRE